MARFTVTLTSDLPADEAWRRIWNLDAHSEVIPLTRLTGDGTGAESLTIGSRFTARTALGPLGVDDVMEVRVFDPPTPTDGVDDADSDTDSPGGHAVLVKRGRTVRGHIDARVVPTSTGSEITWQQDISLRGVPGIADPVVSRVAHAAYARTLDQLLARPRTDHG